MRIGNRMFDTENEIYIMGILNLTPDSFFDGGAHKQMRDALKHTEKMIREGADIIDVGGESTRPSHVKISDCEERERIVPVIREIKREFDIPVSVDTYKPEVAKAALDAGADMVNDVWGFKYDRKLADITASYHAACCLMHNRKSFDYQDFVSDVIEELRESVEIALSAGIPKTDIIVDPGIGFAKDTDMNLVITREVEKLKTLGCPILYAASNKSFIGAVLNKEVENRLLGTLATTAWAVMNGCAFVRVHQVGENKQIIQMTKAIMGGNTNG